MFLSSTWYCPVSCFPILSMINNFASLLKSWPFELILLLQVLVYYNPPVWFWVCCLTHTHTHTHTHTRTHFPILANNSFWGEKRKKKHFLKLKLVWHTQKNKKNQKYETLRENQTHKSCSETIIPHKALMLIDW